MINGELKELLTAAYASSVKALKCRYEYLTLPLNERYEIMLAEKDALAVRKAAKEGEG